MRADRRRRYGPELLGQAERDVGGPGYVIKARLAADLRSSFLAALAIRCSIPPSLHLDEAIHYDRDNDSQTWSDIAVQAYAALGCQFTRLIYAEVGYRYLYDDFRDESADFLYQLALHGAQITVGLTF